MVTRTQYNEVSPSGVDRKEQGATRHSILQLLRRHGQMTAIELSQALNIGAVGVRQHLALLERDGLVQVIGLRRSVGRPSHLYMLTDEAERYFPKTYDQFALEILNHVAEQCGEEAVAKVLQARSEEFVRTYGPRLIGKPRAEQVAELAQILNELGHMCEYQQRDDGSFVLIEHNCPVDCVARHHQQLCLHGLEMYQALMGVPLTRDSTIAEGDLFCRYYIPA